MYLIPFCNTNPKKLFKNYLKNLERFLPCIRRKILLFEEKLDKNDNDDDDNSPDDESHFPTKFRCTPFDSQRFRNPVVYDEVQK